MRPGVARAANPGHREDGTTCAIQRHPRRYYVNVHTGDFPGGAIRGQLFGTKRG